MQYFIVGFSIIIIASIIANKLNCLSPLQSSQTRRLPSSELHYTFLSLRLSFHVCYASHVYFTYIALQTVFFLCCSFFQVNHLHGPFILFNNLESPKEFNLILWIYKYRFCTEIALFITATKEIMMQIETNQDLCVYKFLFCEQKILYSSQKNCFGISLFLYLRKPLKVYAEERCTVGFVYM